MKNRINHVLLALFFLTSVAYGIIFLTYIRYGGNTSPAPLGIYLLRRLHVWLVLGGHAVPAFCLQLLLCRFRCWRVVKALPLTLVLGLALLSGCGLLTATGWDTLGWGILLAGSIAPAAGCVLAWAAYGLYKCYKRGDIRG